MSYTFGYTGNPISNNNPSALGYRYSVNTGGTYDGNYWWSWRIPASSFQNGTYIINASLMTSYTTNSNTFQFIYIIQNRTSSELYYGGIINTPDFGNYNQGVYATNFDPNFLSICNSGPLNGQAVYTILSGNRVGPTTTYGISISTSAIFTYTQQPQGSPNIDDNNTIIAVCWNTQTDTGVPPGSAGPVYITITRIA